MRLYHHVTLLTKVSADAEREWYAAQAIEHGWSRPTLDVHIKNHLHLRQGVAITNFDRHLPTPHAQLAIEALKDPYVTCSIFSASATMPLSATSRTP